MFRSIGPVLAAMGVLAGGAAQGSSVLNGSFEMAPRDKGTEHRQHFDKLMSGHGANWDLWDALPGWTLDTGPGIEVQSNRTLASIDAQDGTHYVELDSTGNSSMFQSVLLSAGYYVLSFVYSPRTSDPATNGIDYSVEGLLRGNVTTGVQGATVGFWRAITQTFRVGQTGTYRLGFAATGRSDSYGGLIDTVSIAPSPAPVPLPAALVLLASGVAGVVAIGRRKRS